MDFFVPDLHRHIAWHAQHFGRVALHVFFADRIVRAASSGDNVQIAWQAWDIVSVILHGRRSIWCRSVVCGMLFCVTSIVIRTL